MFNLKNEKLAGNYYIVSTWKWLWGNRLLSTTIEIDNC